MTRTRRRRVLAAGQIVTLLGGALPNPPAGFSYLIDIDGKYLLDADGNYLIGAS